MAKTEPITKQPAKSAPINKIAEPPTLITTGFDHVWGPEMGSWKPLPTGAEVSNCPPGLEGLLDLNCVNIVQYLEVVEIITGFNTRNRYLIRDVTGQNVLFAMENSVLCCRLCCGQFRRFSMHYYNAQRQEVLYSERPFRNRMCCMLQEMDVFLPPDTMITTMLQKGSCCKPSFVIYGKGRSRLLKIFSPFCHWPCQNIEFRIVDVNDTQIGKITKKWGGVLKELVTKADTFHVTFPPELDVKLKASIICAAMLIDFIFFERD